MNRNEGIALVALCATFSAWFIAQAIKFITWSIQDKKPHWRAFVATGGWPSSHSAMVTCLTCSVAALYDFKLTMFFVISLVLNLIVVHDAVGVRLEASKHAELLNDMTEELSERGIVSTPVKRLKEKLGHRPFEAIAGMLLGALVAVLAWLIFYPFLPAA